MKNARFYIGASKYNFERSLKKHADTLTEEDERLIRGYVDEMQATKHISEARARKLGFTLVGWRRFISAPWDRVTLDDVYRGIAAMKSGQSYKGKPLKQNSQRDFVKILKPFLVWLIDKKVVDIEERKVRSIKAPAADITLPAPSELLSTQDIEALIKVAATDRDRAFISVLYESGVRIGELGRITWRDVIFDEYGVQLYITDTKTNKRRYSRLTMSTEALATLKNHYPGDPQGDAFVFLNEDRSPMSYIGCVRLIQRTAKRAEIKKKINCHLFRHTRVTDMVKQNYQESIIKKSLWNNPSTQQLKNYLSLSEADIDNEFLKRAGIVTVEKDKDNMPLRPRTCARCHTINGPTNEHCSKCGLPLTSEAMSALEDAIMKMKETEVYKQIYEQLRADLQSATK